MRTGALKNWVFKELGAYRTLRELGRTHAMVVQDVVRVQNRIKALCRSRGIAVSGKSVYSEKSRNEYLAKLPDATRAAVETLYAQFDAVEQIRRQAEKDVLHEAHRHPISRVFETCPGLGPIRVAQLIPIVASPGRFRTKRQFWSYCGLGIVICIQSILRWHRQAARAPHLRRGDECAEHRAVPGAHLRQSYAGHWQDGYRGAGLAGLISTYVGLAIMVVYALLPEYRNRFRPFSFGKLSFPLIGSLLKLSIPSSVATIAVMTGFALFAGITSKLDQLYPAGVVSATCPGGAGEPVNGAATTVIVGVLKLTFTACLAFGTSTATLVRQSLGEKRPDRAETFGWTSVRLGLVIFGIVGLLEAVFAPQVLAVVSSSELVRAAALNPCA